MKQRPGLWNDRMIFPDASLIHAARKATRDGTDLLLVPCTISGVTEGVLQDPEVPITCPVCRRLLGLRRLKRKRGGVGR